VGKEMKKLILLLLIIPALLFSDTEKDIKTLKKIMCHEKVFNKFEYRDIEIVKYSNTRGFKFSNFIITAESKIYNNTIYINNNIGHPWKIFNVDRITKELYNIGYSVNVISYRDTYFIYFNFNFSEFRNAFNGVKDFTIRINLEEF
jgi:hypothetical protein